jgi:hypothetical protein
MKKAFRERLSWLGYIHREAAEMPSLSIAGGALKGL